MRLSGRRFSPVFPLLLAALALLSSERSLPARADAGTQVEYGLVSEVDGHTLPAQVTLLTSVGSRDVNLTQETQFTVNGQGGDAAGPYASDPANLFGRFVTAALDPDTSNVTSINVETQFFTMGLVTHVSAPSAPAVLTVDTGFGGRLDLKIDEHSLVFSDFESLSDLDELDGGCVAVTYDPNTLVVATVNESTWLQRARGTLTALDWERRELTLETGGGPMVIPFDLFSFNEDGIGEITLDGVPARTSDLRVGQAMIAYYVDDEGLAASIILAQSRGTSEVSGTVAGVARASQTLRISTGGGGRARKGSRLLKVTPATRIMLRGRRIPLARVPARSRVSGRVVVRGGLALVRTLTVSPPGR